MTAEKREELIKFILTAYWGDQLVAVPTVRNDHMYHFYLVDCGYYMEGTTYTGSWSMLWNVSKYSDPVLDAGFGGSIYNLNPAVAETIIRAIGAPEGCCWDEWFQEED